MMITTDAGRSPRSPAACRAATGTGSGLRRSRRLAGRAGARLWALLHAQALISGTVAGPSEVSFVEDDRRRLAARLR